MPENSSAPELTQEQMRVWKSLLLAHAAVIRRFSRVLQDSYGMPVTWYDVLVHLSLAPDNRLTHSALAQRVVLTGSGTTRVVDRMAAAGLVRREPSSEDRRRSYVVITPDGISAMEAATPELEQTLYEYFGRFLEPGDGMVVDRFLRRVFEGARPGTE